MARDVTGKEPAGLEWLSESIFVFLGLRKGEFAIWVTDVAVLSS